MSKSRDAFRTISEVAELLDTPAHVLRFWETKFSQVKPVKRAGGRRYYRPGDVALLAGIRQLLHDDGLTIKGVQKVLREQGVKHVAGIAPPSELLEEDTASAPPPQEAAFEASATEGAAGEMAEVDRSVAVASGAGDAAVEEPMPLDEPAAPQESATVLPFAQLASAQDPEPEPEAPVSEKSDEDPAQDEMPVLAATTPLFPESEDPAPHAPQQTALWDEDPEAVTALETKGSAPDALPGFLTDSLEERGAAPLPEAVLPELPDLDALPLPAPGPLALLADVRHVAPERAAELSAQLVALQAFVAARQGAEPT
ncbi:MerR family transcriptional regulator [Alloyangia pacifica]|uniref:DNA-binding transcriptional regulator, MerR family n=1 Tax=Alloyangia pacifica TaxID=311180 RepID=A0A1I6PUR1_9RHOB|nr:MerR family transcriptional regulator [Alloyangia pacifica]SDG36070.1 DNA-binding transcriptional regulator, MerR family [Alloyangia pacifica]SFS43967.1 DNA-binding transcriptional regulator, MerR family [Alloyangia pacifica]